MSEQNVLDDAMPGRKLLARWVVRGTLTLDTAMHLGGEATGRVDMPVLRDSREGRPLLPGTTFAGALRNAFADRLGGYSEKEPPEVSMLFGGARGDDDGLQSPLIVFDALGELPPDLGVEIRDGVAISPATGTAEHHKKYDYEVLPAGTTFPVRVDLLVPENAEEKPLLEALATALDGFSYGENSFGAKRSRGLGRVSAAWVAKRYDLASKEGWIEWALSDHAEPIQTAPAHPDIRNVLDAEAPGRIKPPSLLADARKRVVIDLDLKVAHDILVRSPGTEPGAPDVSHLHSSGAPILPGTSLAGVLRAQALRISRLVRDGKNDAELWIDRLFGRRFEGQRPRPGLQPQASRLRVGEAILNDSQAEHQTRVAIDRFTQGVVDSALFDEQTEIGGSTTVRLELRDPKDGEMGLVLLVLKDLLDGFLPVGGTSSIGRGVLTGSGSVVFHDGAGRSPRTAKLEPGKPPSGEAAEEISEAIRRFHEGSALGDDKQSASAPIETGGAA